MPIDIRSACIDSDDILRDLIIQSLDKILDEPYRVIRRDLPFANARAILALDCNQRPALIVFDLHDGGQALLTGLKILESLDAHCAWVTRLHPELLRNGQSTLHAEDFQFYILAPTSPPGPGYLKHGFSQFQALTFKALFINGEAILLIEPSSDGTEQRQFNDMVTEPYTFRTGMDQLKKTEEDYFISLNTGRSGLRA